MIQLVKGIKFGHTMIANNNDNGKKSGSCPRIAIFWIFLVCEYYLDKKKYHKRISKHLTEESTS
jgi:hypothetical protein